MIRFAAFTATAAIFMASSAASAAFIDFNEASDLDDFSHNSVTIVANGGVDNSGFLRSTSGTTGNNGTFTADTFPVGSTLDYSIFVLADVSVQNNTNNANDRAMVTGFESGADYVRVKMGSFGYDSQAGTSTWVLTGQGSDDDGGNTGGFTVSDGNWYLLDVVMTATGNPDEWQIDATLTDYGTDGQTPGAIVGDLDTTVTSAISGSSTFRLQLAENDRTGINGYDNLTIIPEPSTMALIGLGGLVALKRRRQA